MICKRARGQHRKEGLLEIVSLMQCQGRLLTAAVHYFTVNILPTVSI